MSNQVPPTSLPMASLDFRQPGAGLALLQDVRVLDLTTSIAGPYATMLLGDFGAEVIKVERPEGDDARQWGPPFLDNRSLWFTSVNRNKKSVVLDLDQESDRAKLDDLIRCSDVMVTNQPPRVQSKLGLDYETVSSLRDDIIFTSITGFGLNGERADLGCYDLIAEGYSGIMDVTGSPDAPPQKIGAPAADMLAGQDAAMATIAALFDRQRTGKGHLIDVSLVQSMTRMLTPRISSYLGSGELPARSGGTDSVIAIYQAFETQDLPLTLGIGTNAIWGRFCELLGLDNLRADPALTSNADRRRRREELVALIQERLLARRRDDWLQQFGKARIPAGPINRIDELVRDKALQDRGMFYVLDDNGRHTPQIGLGINIDGRHSIARSSPPECGEHTAEVLKWLRGELYSRRRLG